MLFNVARLTVDLILVNKFTLILMWAATVHTYKQESHFPQITVDGGVYTSNLWKTCACVLMRPTTSAVCWYFTFHEQIQILSLHS